MKVIEWRRLIAPLLSASDSSSESKLSAADSKPPSTTSWHSFNLLKIVSQKNSVKYLFDQDFIHNKLG